MSREMLHQLATLGNTGRDGGGALSRLAFTDQDRAGRDLVRDWFLQAGLTVAVDQIGNIFGIWNPGGLDMSWPEHRPVMTGSHIDTVRNAGIYDGPLGVLAGLAGLVLVVEWFVRLVAGWGLGRFPCGCSSQRQEPVGGIAAERRALMPAAQKAIRASAVPVAPVSPARAPMRQCEVW